LKKPPQTLESLSPERNRLVKCAMRARLRSYSPYSKYKVGAAARDNRGKVHSGCNVENVAWATVCAERTALVKMISRGGSSCVEMAVTTSSDEPNFPCGVCLQFLVELAPRATVLAVNQTGSKIWVATMEELLPYAFSNTVWKG
jgi:cytidine deaminase